MDPVLNSIFPTHKIGSDGFNWWVGQIESGQHDDPKSSGRYKVRIIGTHLKECDITPTSHLPWAHVMMPVTTPWSDGGTSGSSIGLKLGSWVIGFYLDNDKQKPMIMGSIGHTAGATLLSNVEKDPNPESSCKSFATFLDQERNPYKHDPMPADDKRNSSDEGDSDATQPGQAGQIAAALPGKGPAIFYAMFAEASETVPTGSKVCVELAEAKCGSEKDLKTGLQNILKDMLKANQDSGGQLGSYLVGKATGELTKYTDIGRKYINKAIRLVKSFIARIKGEIVKYIKKGVDELVKLILYKEVAVNPPKPPTPGSPDNPLDSKLSPKPDTPKTKKVSNIQFIIDLVNEILDDLGCSMENLTEKIAQYITDLLFDFLMNAFSAATCLVDQLVDGIINQIISFIESSLGEILGILQELLSVIASPLDIIGGIINKIFDFLGISCDGPDTSCQKTKKECTECDVEKTDDDWLDKLISDIEDGPLNNSSGVCAEATEPPALQNTSVVFIGGIFDEPTDSVPVEELEQFDPESPVEYNKPVSVTNLIKYTSSDVTVTEGQDAEFVITRSGNISTSSSIGVKVVNKTAEEGEDFIRDYDSSVLGFAPNETTKSIKFKTLRDSTVEGEQTFGIRLDTRYFPVNTVVSYPDGRDFTCTILDSDFADNSPGGGGTGGGTTPYIPPAQTNIQPYIPVVLSPVTIPQSLSSKFFIRAEKPFYYEGESPVFEITSVNVDPGTVVSYSLDISPADIVGGLTSGTFVVDDAGKAQVTFTLAENNDNVRIDPPGTVALTDEDGNFIVDEDGNVLYNTEEIVTDIPDDNEPLTFTIDSTGDSAFITILGENNNEPSYFVRADKASVSEGESVLFNVSTTNVPDNTVLNYELTGDILSTDVNINLVGELTIVSGKAVVEVGIVKDDLIEDTKALTFNLIDDSIVVADDTVFIAGDIDEDIPSPYVTRTFAVDTDKLQYNEGEVIEYTITTTNVSDGTVLQYIMYGPNITANDFVLETTYGEFVVIDNTAKVYIGIKEDTSIEQNETVTFLITGTSAFADVIILAQDDVLPPVKPPKETLCISPPIAGDPITNDVGSIISIPIIDLGCPYVEPPRVIISGAGIGASAIALLDNNGRVSEIRVTRVGAGYKKNTPINANLKCVIDSFTLINPGRGYKSAPDVYVNGIGGIAKAIIDDQGYVSSVQILDRSIEFTSLPKVTFNGGGGGAGARFLPNVVCLDTLEELALNGYAKIGTGKYIDCP